MKTENINTAEIENVHVLKITYMGATDTKGSRINIRSERFSKSVLIPYNHYYNSILGGAESHLIQTGFNILSHAEGKDCYYIITNTFKAPVK